jgi:hypothetical protein
MSANPEDTVVETLAEKGAGVGKRDGRLRTLNEKNGIVANTTGTQGSVIG